MSQRTLYVHLSGEIHSPADLGASSYSHLRDHYAVLTNPDVVGNHGKIVYLGTLAYHGATRGRPVDSHIRAHLDIVD